MTPSAPAYRLEGVSVRYPRGRGLALDAVTCDLHDGVVGVIGVNGAGKSTLLSLLATARRPTSGRIDDSALGASHAAVRGAVSWVQQSVSLPRGFTVDEYLEHGAFLQGVPRTERRERARAALAAVDLADSGGRRCGALSGGQARRLAIAWGLLRRPRVLLLDEPTAGLDVYQRRAVRALVADRPAPLVVVTSHLLSDVRDVADHLLVLDAGRLAYAGPMSEAAAILAADDVTDPEEQLIRLLDRVRPEGP